MNNKSKLLKRLMLVSILINGYFFAPLIWGKTFQLTKVLSTLRINYEKFQRYSSEGKTVKAERVLKKSDGFLNKFFKRGKWYTLPSDCIATWPDAYTKAIYVQCSREKIYIDDMLQSFSWHLRSYNSKSLEKIQELEQGKGYSLKFQVGASRVVPFGKKYSGYIHTNFFGFSIYIKNFKVQRSFSFEEVQDPERFPVITFETVETADETNEEIKESNTQSFGCQKGDCENGTGFYLHSDSTTYQGQFVAGKRQGKGTCHYSNGDKYKGQWKNNNPDGVGIYYFANGNIYSGEWKLGKWHGKGTFTNSKGESVTGKFINNEQVE